MDIDKVYVCDIYRLDKITYNCIDTNYDLNLGFSLDNFLHIKRKISYVKTALVYFSLYKGGFIDLETGDWYRLDNSDTIC